MNPTFDPAFRLMGQLAMLALVVWREARNESDRTKLAVAYTAMHRVERPRGWGQGVLGVLFHPWAFSSVTDPRDVQLTRWPSEGPVWDSCLRAAAAAMFKLEADPVPGAVFYHSMTDKEPPRAWGPVEFITKLDAIWFFKQ